MQVRFSGCALVVIALSIGCSQPVSPTNLTSAAARNHSAGASGTFGKAGNAAEAAIQNGDKEVSFRGNLTGTVTVTPLDPPFAFVLIKASGTASHLGRFTLEIPHRVNFANSTGVGSFEFIAANGDRLTATFTGQAQVGPVISIVETATITGGTGRFAGATGSFIANRSFDPTTGVTTGSFEGTLSPPGAIND